MSRPLEGIKVLDVSQFISGPTCAMILGEMGAEVIKVEPPIGDTLRLLTSYVDPEFESWFCQLNPNKKGITLNLKNEKATQIFKELSSRSDVVVENLGPGVMESFGLGYDDLRKLNPKLIYVSISGFGKTGPYKNRTAFDLIAQATGGTIPLVSRIGNKPKLFIADVCSGIYAALGAMFALYHREKTGEGQLVDISMQDVVLSINIPGMIGSVFSEEKVKEMGMSFSHYPPGIKIPLYGIHPTLDGEVTIAAITDAQAKRFFKAMGREDLVEKFPTFISRFDHDTELIRIVDEWTSKMKKDEIIRKLVKARVPCGPAYSTFELNKDEQLKARNMFVDVEYKNMKFPVLGVAVKLSESPGSIRTPAPELGQHNEEIFSSLRYTKEDIEEFKKNGIC